MNPLRIISILFLLFLTISAAADKNSGKKYVLYLNSYHKGYKWSDDITEAIESKIRQKPFEIVFFVEYMDTKKINDSTYLNRLPGIYNLKYNRYKFDAVICSDNNALDFMIKFGKRVFPGVPVIFCGINSAKGMELKRTKGFTGIIEVPAYRENLDFVLKLHPGTEKIIFITDATSTGAAISRQIRNFLTSYNRKLQYEIWDNKTINEMRRDFRNLPEHSIVFLSFFFQDREGVTYEYYESTSLITEYSPFPVYSFWDFNLNHGTAGGKVIGGTSQGRAAADMALEIIGGKDTDQMKIRTESPSSYMFDYNILRKFNINPSLLPESSTILNKPESIYEKFFFIIWTASVSFIFLFAVIGILTINILKRRKTEMLLRKSRDRLQLVIESTQDSLWDYYPLDDCLVLDENWKRITGHSSEKNGSDMMSWHHIIHPHDKNLVESTLAEHIRGKTPFIEVKYRITAADGSRRWIMTRGRIVDRDSKGRARHLTGTNRDISDLQNREKQIQHMQKIETTGTLASGLAHDFNNILTGISGTLYFVKRYMENPDEYDREKVNSHVENSTSIINRAAAMTRQLLNLTRKEDITLSTFNLNRTLENIHRLLSTSTDKSISIRLNPFHGEALITAEESRIEQILLNICINAAQAMTLMRPPDQEYGGDLVITLRDFTVDELFLRKHPATSDRHLWIIEISDTGVGMEKEVLSKIFDPFYTTKEKGLGTGLGLSMVYDIVKQYGGFIDVYSEPLMGTTFFIYFPKTVNEESTEETKGIINIKGNSETILLIDDEETILSVCRNFLEERDFIVKTAVSGKEGIEVFRENCKDIKAVYIDMVMPGLSGKETAGEIRKINPQVPVVISTGLRGDARIKEFNHDGNSFILYKPFTMSQFASALQKFSR